MNRDTRRALRRTLAIALVTSALAWVAWGIWREAGRTDWSTLHPDPGPLAAAASILAAAYLFRASLFNHVVRSMGEPIRWIDGWRIFLGAQLGRYLPGKVWQIAGASAMAARYGVSGAAAGTATLVAVLVHHVVGGALSLFALGELSPGGAWTGAAVAGAAVLGLAAIASPLFGRSLRWLATKTGREGLSKVEPPSLRALLWVTPGYAIVWLAFALALALVARGLFPSVAWLSPATAIGAMAASALAGFLVLVAPSGLGVREAVLVALLGPALGVVPASLVAFGLRLLMTLIELSLSLWGAWPHLRAREVER